MNPKIKGYIFGPILWAWQSNNSASVVMAIDDEKIIPRIIQGPRGLSPEMKVTKLECSICRQNYEDCEHVDGQTYTNETCTCLMAEWEAINTTFVSKPEDPRSRVIDMLVFKRNSKSCTWYGFDTNNDNERFQNIQTAKDKKFISEKAALCFSTFFITNAIGNVTYPTT